MTGNDEHTFIDPQEVRATASHLGGLLDDMEAFRQLAGTETKAGGFETAGWLENVVHDRQSGLLRHATDLKAVLDEVEGGLGQITETFEQTDQHSGQNLDRSLHHEVNVLKINAYTEGKKAESDPAPRRDET